MLDESNLEELCERASGLSEPDVRQLVLRIRLGQTASSETGTAPSLIAGVQPATPPAATVAADAVATST